MVSFIIVNYNTYEETKKCVDTIYQYVKEEEFEIVVVDNASRADELERLRLGLGDRCTLVESRFNTGFGLGNMLGVNVAKGDFLCFINSDAYLEDDCVSPLCQYLREHPSVGSITPQQINLDGRPVPTFNHGLGIVTLLLPQTMMERWNSQKYPARHRFDRKEPYEVFEISGSFMLFRTEVFHEIGGFDVNIFLYREEYDLGYRLKYHGYTSVVHPHYTYRHAVGTSTSKNLRSIQERKISKIYTYSKYHGFLLSWVYALLLIFIQVVLKPKRWCQLPALLSPDPMSKSMRHYVNGRAAASKGA